MGEDPSQRDGTRAVTETQDDTEEATLLPSGPILLDGLPTRAPVVLTLRAGEAALWMVDLAGQPCGAWLLPASTKEEARTILGICAGRAFVAVRPENPIDHILELAETAGVDIARSTLEARLCSIDELLRETTAARAMYTQAVRDVQDRDGKKPSPLSWPRPVPAEPDSVQRLMEVVGVRVQGDRGTELALQIAYLARWAIRLWVETEGIRSRRRYLRDLFGPSQPLPPSWRDAITEAFRQPLAAPSTE